LEILGKYRGALIIDDYAHHPTEIKAALSGVKSFYQNKKLIVVFHPHTYTRTKVLLADFAQSFALADEVIILGIYGSAREKQGGVSSVDLVKKIKEFNKQKKIKQSVRHFKNLQLAESYLAKHLSKNELLLLMGAGDVFRIGQGLLKKA
jgi:UDP-N-acetylmuramate--alanine ligase